MVMIIKGLFRKYKTWNPVHPTYGAFWGMGLGIGCGVGWGPGFGPEVIGYVGSGCGVGFSVGITLAGVGIGLPATTITEAPYKALLATRSYTRDLMQSNNFCLVKNNAQDDFNVNFPSQLWSLQQKANESFSYLRDLDIFKKGTQIFDVKDVISSHGDSISKSFGFLKKSSSDSDKALLATRSYTEDLMQSSNSCSVRNNAQDDFNAKDDFNVNIPSQLWSLQQKANESFSYLKDLDIFKKGTEIFDVKDAMSSQRDSILKTFRFLKTDSSDSDKGNKE